MMLIGRSIVVMVAFHLARISLAQDSVPRPLFDGKTLDGWKAESGKAEYRVEDGAIVGKTVEGSGNTFLCKGPFRDFVVDLDVKCDPALNSGVQVRSHLYEAGSEGAKRHGVGRIYGPQCEIAVNGTAGKFYDEARVGKWIDGEEPKSSEAAKAFKADGWNHYRIVVQGDHYRSWINGVPTADFTDGRDSEGLIGLQVHAIAKGTGPYEVRWKNVMLLELAPGQAVPAPVARP
ncbi:3-keto-disaccharide hydrolase [Paludisphaera rhizosphaerae]|uniref:3-keto-disaccharide hydrolase n=1 Tax=Paludisphaera rhizosphaerae TaxID=2711216 RepID=UPI0013EB04B9|nr:DUF1080 domain-containing protein [Paludisphaera rhizosphaerae]